MASDSIYKIVAFLKYVYDETKDDKAIHDLPYVAFKQGVPYSQNICAVLIDKGILEAHIKHGPGQHGLYKWKSTTEPNLNMAEAVLTLLRNQKNVKTEIPEIEFPTLIVCDNSIDAGHLKGLISCKDAIAGLDNKLLINKEGYIILTRIKNLLNKYLKN